jgi:hypothetical protein
MAAILFVAVYMSGFLSLYILRSSQPDLLRPFRMWGYPWTNLAICLGTGAFLAASITADLKHALFTLAVIAFTYSSSRPSRLSIGRTGPGLPNWKNFPGLRAYGAQGIWSQAEGEWFDRPGPQVAWAGADYARDNREASDMVAGVAAREGTDRYENCDGLGLQRNSTNHSRGTKWIGLPPDRP